MIFADSHFVAGTSSNTDGAYTLKLPLYSNNHDLSIKVSAMGYDPRTIPLSDGRIPPAIDFILEEKSIAVAPVVVRPVKNEMDVNESWDKNKIDMLSSHSIIPTNPISAIRQPQVVRQGSNHSSKLRINGTSPTYSINGFEIGMDPNHYGMFSIVPSSVVDQIRFTPQGTDISQGAPSAIELKTAQPFDRPWGGEVNLSMIEATGSTAIGGNRYFILSSFRNSIIDKISPRSERMTIPPTEFRDFFISTGLKLSPNIRFYSDQYFVKDRLSYVVSSTSNNPQGIKTLQYSQEAFIGLRLEALFKGLLLTGRFSAKSGSEFYNADSGLDSAAGGFQVSLDAHSQVQTAAFEAVYELGRLRITMGDQVKFNVRREIDLSQRNWNFLSFDANSDNPFIYQAELNRFYGQYQSQRTESGNAGYVSIKQYLGDLEMESGVRAERFDGLASKWVATFRHSVNFRLGNNASLGLTYGSYAQSPIGRILEPYQVLVDADQEQLRPIQTKLVTWNFTDGMFKIGVFSKTMSYLPVPAPDFQKVSPEGIAESGFIGMQPSGQVNSYGADLSVESDHFLHPRLSVYGYYGYTHSDEIINGITIPYDLNAPHRFMAQLGYKLSRQLTLGGSLSLRSGYPYTDAPPSSMIYEEQRYTGEYYHRALRLENQNRFPVNIGSSIFADFSLGNIQLYLSVSNISNYSNPVVRTADGYIYDAGILPSVGLKCRF